jgi:ABC-2 type transport system permease protein
MKLMPLANTIDVGGEIGRRIKEAAELAVEYRGYVWSHWFSQNLAKIGTLFAALLGTGGLFSQASGGGVLFTLSLPASRNRLVAVRAAAGLSEWFVLAFVPSLLIPLLSPAIGEKYSVGNTLIHSACLFIAGAAFFSLAFLLSTVFNDVWRPLLIAVSVAVILALFGEVSDMSRFSVFRVMSGELYFRTGELPWLGLLASVAASAAMLYGAVVNTARRDF